MNTYSPCLAPLAAWLRAVGLHSYALRQVVVVGGGIALVW
jgi:hypothetical protein